MARLRRSTLGIEFNLDEVRVVEAQPGIGGVTLVGGASAVVPPMTTEGGRIKDKGALQDSLKRALADLGAKAKTCVVGVPAQAVAIRTMDLPQMPEADLRAVMSGEIQHLQMLSEPGGAFDYTEIEPTADTKDGDHRFLVMATEESLLDEFRELCSSVGLKAVAFEPVTMSLFRAAYGPAQNIAVALVVSVSEIRTDISIVRDGDVKFYRRVNMGTDELKVSPSTEPELPEGVVFSEETIGAPRLNRQSALGLAIEIRRSLDYYRRQHFEVNEVGQLLVSVADSVAEELAQYLQAELQAPVMVAEPRTVGGVAPQASDLTGPNGRRFTAAAALTTFFVATKPGAPPKLDLVDPQRITIARTRMKFLLSLGLSVVILMLGVAFGLGLGRTRADAQVRLDTTRAQVETLNQEQKTRTEEQVTRQNQIAALEKEGVLVPQLMDAIDRALDADASLTSVSVDVRGQITISGVAKTTESVTKTRDMLTRFVAPTAEISSINDGTDEASRGLKTFNIVIQPTGRVAS
ncbi:MAG: pilus assembly protein PilM [Fimbriimonadaceae bacterium]